MARKIEQALTAAVKAGKPFNGGNTAYDPSTGTVTLHGNLIARQTGHGWSFTLAGYNTPTTRSRLNALGAGVSTRAGVAQWQGHAISDTQWFHETTAAEWLRAEEADRAPAWA